MQSSPDAFHNFEYAMKIVGWVPLARGKLFYVILKTLMMWALIWVPCGMFGSYVMDFANYSPGELITSMQVSFNAMGSMVKVIILLLNLWRFHQVKELLCRLDEYCNERAERIQVNFSVQRCNFIYLVYQILYSGYIICTFAASAFRGVAPWRIYNPFLDWHESTTNLYLASVLEFLFTHFASMQNQMTDVYPLLCGTMLRVHINLLQQKVQNLRTDPNECEMESYQHLAKCIANHQLIKELANLLRPIVSLTIFIQFLLIGICLGCALVNLLLFADFWSGVATAVYIAAVMIQTFPFCYTCELIKTDCQALSLAIFHSNWVGASKGYKSTLISFLHCAQQPIEYTAGSTFSIGMETNIKMAKLAFSVVTFAKQLNLAEK